VGVPNLRFLTQLIQEIGFLPDLDVITKEECNREEKKGEKISPYF
jgi:hypothetical protein